MPRHKKEPKHPLEDAAVQTPPAEAPAAAAAECLERPPEACPDPRLVEAIARLDKRLAEHERATDRRLKLLEHPPCSSGDADSPCNDAKENADA
jgi:hypothetical protein